MVAEILAFADRHRSEVDAYLTDCQAELDRQFAAYQPRPAALRIRRLVEQAQAQAWRPGP
jgi:hypothetical protein